jgi:multiple sugar transport system ATP-binding protein
MPLHERPTTAKDCKLILGVRPNDISVVAPAPEHLNGEVTLVAGVSKHSSRSPAMSGWRSRTMRFTRISTFGETSPSRCGPRGAGQFDDEEIERLVRSTAALLQIEGMLEKPVVALSGGQKQRVALGRALIRNPTVLLLDEPVTHLDARLRHEMRVELKLLQRRVGTTTIHVTHDQLEAQALGDLIVVMRDGLIEQVGSPDELCARPATSFVAGFVGDPPMSLLQVRLEREAGTLSLRVGKMRLRPGEQLARLLDGFRDQHVEISLPAEDLSLGHGGDAQTVSGRVQAHEWVGRELQIVVMVDGSLVRLRTHERLALRIGDEVAIRLNLKRAHAFDPKTERTLGSSTG